MIDYLRDKKDKIAISKHLLITLVASVFAIGVFTGAAVNLFTPFPPGKAEMTSGRSEGTFKFIRASLDSKNPEKSQSSRELKPFKYKVTALIENMQKEGDAVSVSMHFRDLNTGIRFSIRGVEKILSRNQWKLPLMIAYFKWAESNPLVLRKKLTFTAMEVTPDPVTTPSVNSLEPGKTYTVNDLIYRMIIHDDPAAQTLLSSNLPAARLEKVLKDLDMEYDPNEKDDALSLNSFSAFYRVLFNASYLSEEMSEKALRYLSQSVARDGMGAGIPSNIDIARKRGDLSSSVTAGKENRLHQMYEFGIIYHPSRPFLLGIAARGKDPDNLLKVIRDITRLIYNEVDLQS